METMRSVLAGAGLPPAHLVVELTESALLDVGEATTVAIAGLKNLGIVRLARSLDPEIVAEGQSVTRRSSA